MRMRKSSALIDSAGNRTLHRFLKWSDHCPHAGKGRHDQKGFVYGNVPFRFWKLTGLPLNNTGLKAKVAGQSDMHGWLFRVTIVDHNSVPGPRLCRMHALAVSFCWWRLLDAIVQREENLFSCGSGYAWRRRLHSFVSFDFAGGRTFGSSRCAAPDLWSELKKIYIDFGKIGQLTFSLKNAN